MQSLVSLQAYPVDLREYLGTHRLPTVFEVSATEYVGTYTDERTFVNINLMDSHI